MFRLRMHKSNGKISFRFAFASAEYQIKKTNYKGIKIEVYSDLNYCDKEDVIKELTAHELLSILNLKNIDTFYKDNEKEIN